MLSWSSVPRSSINCFRTKNECPSSRSWRAFTSKASISPANPTTAGMSSCDRLASRHQRRQHDHQSERRTHGQGLGRGAGREAILPQHPELGRARQRYSQPCRRSSGSTTLHRRPRRSRPALLRPYPVGERRHCTAMGRHLGAYEARNRPSTPGHRHVVRGHRVRGATCIS